MAQTWSGARARRPLRHAVDRFADLDASYRHRSAALADPDADLAGRRRNGRPSGRRDRRPAGERDPGTAPGVEPAAAV